MIGTTPSPTLAEVEAVLDHELRPAFGAHAGSIEVTSVADGRIALKMLASCGSCYFRRGCVQNFVAPTIQSAFGADVDFVVSNVR